MRRLRPLPIAICLSLAVHLLGFVHAGPDDSASVMPDSAPRLMASLSRIAGTAPVAPQPMSGQASALHSKPAVRPGKAEVARLPETAAGSAPVPGKVKKPFTRGQAVTSADEAKDSVVPDTVDSTPVVAQSQVPQTPQVQSAPSAAAPWSSDSEVVADAAASPPVSASGPADGEAVTRLTTRAVAETLPREGKITFTGTAGGVLALNAMGAATWSHDGQHFQARLSAGFTAPDSALDYSSEGVLQGTQMISLRTRDNRRGRVSTGAIDLPAGKVVMHRGQDTRERQIRGLAVAISALPEMLMVMDENVSSAAFFVVGDFWVDDAIVAQKDPAYLRLPVGRVRSRHYATRTRKGDQIDVWLAPEWHNAPVRILIRTGGMFVDLKASEVMIDGSVLAEASDTP